MVRFHIIFAGKPPSPKRSKRSQAFQEKKPLDRITEIKLNQNMENKIVVSEPNDFQMHEIALLKMRGYKEPWPCRVIFIKGNQAIVRFFGYNDST